MTTPKFTIYDSMLHFMVVKSNETGFEFRVERDELDIWLEEKAKKETSK